MDSSSKKILRALSLEIRHTLEGRYDSSGDFLPGDLPTRLNELGVWPDRPAKPLEELPHLSAEDKAARETIDAYIAYRAEAGVERREAVQEFVRESAYNWANRLLALRCMEARGIIDEVILQKEVYGGRSMVHNRLARRDPEACAGPDEGLFAVLFAEFEERAKELPELFNPRSPAIALRPSLPSIKRVIGLLSGTLHVNGQEAATDEVFFASDALGWAYQYWNTEEKDRVNEKVRGDKSARIEGLDIISATQLYTEDYMVKFLVQNSLGKLWVDMHPESNLVKDWVFFVRNGSSGQVKTSSIHDVRLLDPACGSGHFLLEAFDLLYSIYQEEELLLGRGISLLSASEIASTILNNNLYGIDIDERATQITTASLWMRAKEVAPELSSLSLEGFHQHIIPTNIHLPKGKDHLKTFLQKHPDSAELQIALEAVFSGLENVHELGSLVQIEEIVDKELRDLSQRIEEAKKRGVQPNFFEPTVFQGELPLGVETHDQWKEKILQQLKQHLKDETEVLTSSQSFFGNSAFKALSLFENLSRRYDIVVANPPYLGYTYLGEKTKEYIEFHYKDSKYDFLAAFISRCLQLSDNSHGIIAMVTRKVWMYLKSYVEMRQAILRENQIKVICDLGSKAFDPLNKLHDGVTVALFVIESNKTSQFREFPVFDVSGMTSPEEKTNRILQLLSTPNSSDVYHITQTNILNILDSPFIYWVTPKILDVLNGERKLRDFVEVRQGLSPGDTKRFVRFFYESLSSNAWPSFPKGGGYKKWFGKNHYVIDWRFVGRNIACTSGGRVQNTQFYFKKGYTYPTTAGGSLCVRSNLVNTITSDASSGIFLHNDADKWIICLLNSRIVTFLIRSTYPKVDFPENYVANIALPNHISEKAKNVLSKIAESCILYAMKESSGKIDEYCFNPSCISVNTLSTELLRLCLEAISERIIADEYYLDNEDLDGIYSRTSIPSCFYPLLEGYSTIPKLDLDDEIVRLFSDECKVISLPEKDLEDTIRFIRFAFETKNLKEAQQISNENDSQEEVEKFGANIPVPDDGLLEKISNKFKISPISVYWIIFEGIESNGWDVSLYEKQQRIDQVTVSVLNTMGYYWPIQAAERNVSPESDPDGIIPLNPGLRDLPLLDRVRSRLPEQFPGGNVATLEHEFAEIMGESLEKWLNSTFFKHHISQFKKRPIAWQISSQPANAKSGKGKAKRGLDKAPAFSCLVYYHKLNAGMLTTIKSQYVSPLRQSFETEYRTFENMVLSTPEQSARRYQLEAWIDELKDFEDRLERCSREGFFVPTMDQVLEKEPLDGWTSRDGKVPKPSTRQEFLEQEMRYDPDINDGVRVNIAPLQKYGLLAAKVLDDKDVKKAIEDRAEWRADERRWCREGKLPRPGWWKE